MILKLTKSISDQNYFIIHIATWEERGEDRGRGAKDRQKNNRKITTSKRG